jgi:serine/threonine protein phosphatase 1
MEFNRVLAFGDAHGNYTQLKQLISRVNPTKEDLLIFLGDYIDRGNQSLDCLKLVMKLSKQDNVIVLRGNHEQMMLDYFSEEFSENNYGDIWLSNGGDKTLKDLKDLSDGEFSSIIEFVESLPIKYELNNFFFCHAGVNPRIDFEHQLEDDMLWIREDFLFKYDKNKIVVVGHTPTQCIVEDRNVPILLPNNIVMCDTGSFLDNGKVSCVNVLTNKFWQSDARK